MLRKHRSFKRMVRVCDALDTALPFIQPKVMGFGDLDAIRLEVLPYHFELISLQRNRLWMHFTVLEDERTRDVSHATEPAVIPASRDELNVVVSYVCQLLGHTWQAIADDEEAPKERRVRAIKSVAALSLWLEEEDHRIV